MKKQLYALFLLTFLVSRLAAQSVTITGTVTDNATGEAIPGASILVEGTQNGTVADINGKFTLVLSNSKANLLCSFIGYTTAKLATDGKTQFEFKLTPDVTALDEVVVVGYGTIAKQNLTTSVAKVKTDDVPKAANNSVSQLLFGRAAGLTTTQKSAEPGGRIDLSIRGRGTPLVVVDGVAYPADELNPSSGVVSLNNVNRGGIGNINPEDIESIEILKDASAAIYGIGASNGVVLITTKKGKQGRLNVSYNGSKSVVENLSYLEPLSPADYMTYYNQFNKDYYWASKNMEPFGKITPRIPKSLFLYSDSAIANAGAATDWLGKVLRNGSIDNHNINISGGSDKVSYYISGNYFNQMGTIEKSGLKRYMGKLDLTIQLNKFIKLNTAINATRSNYTNGMSGYQSAGSGAQGYGALQAAVAYPTLLPEKDADGNYSKFQLIGNPEALLSITDQTQQSALFANTYLDIDIIPKTLTARLLYGNNYETSLRNFFVPSTVFYQMLNQSRGAIENGQRQKQTLTGYLSYTKRFDDILNIDVMTGYEQNTTDYFFNGMAASGMLDAMQFYSLGAAPNRDQLSSKKGVDRKRSYFSRGNFEILDKYLISLTYRYDGIDKFFPDNKYASFPSASVGWKISKEEFMRSMGFIDLFKIRASAGITGDAENLAYAAYGRFDPETRNQAYFDNGSTVYAPYFLSALDLPNLGWQKTLNTNAGLDFAFFRNRISGSVDLFYDKITNLLNSKTTPQLSIITSQYANGGQQVRSGWEIALKTVNISTESFQWDMVVNISHYLYRWEKRYSNMGLQSYVKEHDPVNAIYAFPTNGIIKIGDSIPASQYTVSNAAAAKPGCPLFVDKDHNDTINNADVQMYNPDPSMVIGVGNNLRYKNIDFGIFFYSQMGASDFNNAYAWSNAKNLGTGNSAGTTSEIKNAWSTINPNGTLPGASYDEDAVVLTARTDATLQSKDFIRCRSITVGYTLNSKGTITYFKSLRLFAELQNPFIITDYKIVDPEIQYVSVKGGSAPYPMSRTYSFGINLNF